MTATSVEHGSMYKQLGFCLLDSTPTPHPTSVPCFETLGWYSTNQMPPLPAGSFQALQIGNARETVRLVEEETSSILFASCSCPCHPCLVSSPRQQQFPPVGSSWQFPVLGVPHYLPSETSALAADVRRLGCSPTELLLQAQRPQH